MLHELDPSKVVTSKLRQVGRKMAVMEVSESIRKRLREGETIYWTDKPPHNGKFVAYSRWRDSFGRPHRSSTKGFSSDRDALEFLLSVRGDQQRKLGRYADRPLRDWYEFVSTKKWPSRLSATTIANKKGRWVTYISQYFGPVPMKAITKAAVVAWLEELMEAENPRTHQIIESKNDLHKLFEDAIDLEEIDRNPVRNAELATPRLRSKVILGPDKIRSSLSLASAAVEAGQLPQWILSMTVCGLLAGLRKGECQALAWGLEGVDLKTGFINVSRAAHRAPGGKLTIGLPKGGKKRRVAIPDQLKEILQKSAPQDLDAACAQSRLVFPSSAGTMIHPKQIRTTFSSLVELCHLPTEMQFRDTRATFASLLDAIAIGPKTALDSMGHERIELTTERYMESLDESKVKAAKDLNKLVSARPKLPRKLKQASASQNE
jgi:integrase